MKRTIRLKESVLKSIISESVSQVLKESCDREGIQSDLSALMERVFNCSKYAENDYEAVVYEQILDGLRHVDSLVKKLVQNHEYYMKGSDGNVGEHSYADVLR